LNSRQFTSLSIKVIGVFFFIQGFILLSNVLYSIFSPYNNDQLYNTFNIIMALSIIVFAILLYRFSNKLAMVMLEKEMSAHVANEEYEEEYEELQKITVRSIHNVAFSVLGLFFMGTSLPKLVALLLQIFFLPDNLNMFFAAVGSILQFVIGLIIFLSSYRLVYFLNNVVNKKLNRD